VVLALGSACSAPPTAGPEAHPPQRATATLPATVGLEKADLYRVREVAGVVELRPPRPQRSTRAGAFTRAPGLRSGAVVRRGDPLGTVRTCDAASAAVAAPTTGSFTPSAAPSHGAADATTPTCSPRWHAVTATVSGTLTELSDGQVAKGATVGVVRPAGYVIRATVTDQAALYDLMKPPPTGRTRIVGGPAGFTVRFERRTYDPADGAVELTLAVPTGITVVEGLRTSTAFVVGRRTAVPTLPISAVQGTTGVGQVVVLRNGRPQVTSVELGQHDGERIEVRGLPSGARVVRFPLASDFTTAP
jgi:hypothetical protein